MNLLGRQAILKYRNCKSIDYQTIEGWVTALKHRNFQFLFNVIHVIYILLLKYLVLIYRVYQQEFSAFKLFTSKCIRLT